MELLLGSARNICHTIMDGKAVPSVEVVLITEKPKWSVDAGGTIRNSSEVTHMRFMASTHALREVAKNLIDVADEADAEAARIKVAKPEGGTP